MNKIAVTLTVAALTLGLTAFAASAQTQLSGAGNVSAQARNFTPIVKQVACNGLPGPWCGPGWIRRCWRGPFGRRHCRCVPCY